MRSIHCSKCSEILSKEELKKNVEYLELAQEMGTYHEDICDHCNFLLDNQETAEDYRLDADPGL